MAFTNKKDQSKFTETITWLGPSLLVCAALFAQLQLRDVIGDRRYLLLFPSIFFGTLFRNKLATVIATIAATLGTWVFLVPPLDSASSMGVYEFVGPAILFACGILASVLSAKSFLAATFWIERKQAQENYDELAARFKKQAELFQKKESEAQFRTFAESIPQLAWIAHPDGFIFWYNSWWYDYTGTTPEQMEGWGWQSVHDPEVLPSVMERWTGAIKAGTPFEMTFPLKSKDGEYRSFLTRVNPVRDSEGNIVRWFGTNTDVEDVLGAQRELVDTLESMSDAFFSLDKNWRFTRVNKQHEKLSNLSREHQIGKTIFDLWFNDPKYEDSLYLKSYRKAMTERVSVTFEDYYDPLKFWTEVRVYPKSDGGIAVFFTDITERKTAQMERERNAEILLQTEANLRATIESSAGGFYGVDKNGVTTVCNTAFLEMLGFESMNDAVGKKLHDVIHHTHPGGRHYPKEECPIYQAAGTGMPAHVEDEFFYRLDGSSIPVEYWTTPIVRNGEVLGAVTTFIDITERKKAQADILLAKEQAEKLKEEAERANALKSAFLANMSHEIRTPLGAMMGFADLLKDPALTVTERQSFTNILSRNGESLSVIINDILDLSKVEAGHLTLEYTDTYPDQIGADVVSLLRVKANEKDLVLEYTHDETSSTSIVADPIRVRQILLNLVGNAIKFTQFGSVVLRSFVFKSERGRDALCFEVADTGIGIAKDQQEKVFEMFVQADGSMTRRFGGTGLGLSLSRHLARAMGGDIVITESQEGVGSKFLVTVEDQPEKRNEITAKIEGSEVRPQELAEKALEGVKILVVDDAPDNQQLIWRYLTKQGAHVESAENGYLGYRAALAGRFDLVLMDIQMPVMDGYAATQKLRESGYTKPIIALTAHAMNEVRRKAFNVGYTDHLTKPIIVEELIGTIARHIKMSIQ